MRLFFLFFMLYLSNSTIQAQDGIEIIGPIQVYNNCAPVRYYVEVLQTEVNETSWILEPSTGFLVIDSQAYGIAILFLENGVFTLIATSTSVNNEIFQDTITIFVSGISLEPLVVEGCYQINPSNDCYQVCEFSETYVTDFNNGNQLQIEGADSVEYIFNGNYIIHWGPAGSGSIISGNTDCGTNVCFEILPAPVAEFQTTPGSVDDTLIVCKGQDVYFTNQSLNGLFYTWTFGDGTVSTDYHVTHHFGNEGYFTVNLNAASICCESDKEVVVEVLPTPALELDCVNSICPESRQRYTVTTNNCAQYHWTVSSNGTIVGGGSLTDNFIEIIWHEGPDGIISLEAENCVPEYCMSASTFRIPIISPDGPISGDERVCSNELGTYQVPYFPGAIYQWNVSNDGVIISDPTLNAVTIQWNAVNANTASTITVNYDNCFLECQGTDQFNVLITPEIIMTGDRYVCQGYIATAAAYAGFVSTFPVDVLWSIEDEAGNVFHTEAIASAIFTHAFTYPAGEYFWVASNSSGTFCNELVRLAISVIQTPNTTFTIKGETEICVGEMYGYTIESNGNYSTLWTVIDGGTTFNFEGQTIQHAFGAVPPYRVEAVQTDIQFQSCISQPVSLDLITPDDFVLMGSTEGCLNSIDSFQVPFISGTEYAWQIIPADAGEIRISNQNSIAVFWTRIGNATIRLDACGKTIDKNVYIHPLPVFQITGPKNACPGDKVEISSNQLTFQHSWVSESGSIIGNLNSISLFPGTYSLEAFDSHACSDKHAFEISSYPVPIVHLTTPSANLYCTSIPGDVKIYANTDAGNYLFEWFLNNVSLGLSGPIWDVTSFGDYHVTVINQYGCRTVSQKITFNNCCPPSACGGPAGGPFPAGCSFTLHDFDIVKSGLTCNERTYTPQLPGIEPGSEFWKIESNSLGTIHSASTNVLNYQYTLPGYYHITSVARLNGFPYTPSNCGHYQIIIDTIRSVADYTFEGRCAGANIDFEDLTTYIPGETIASWHWEFDDPASGVDNISSLQHPTHIFATSGTYDVTLIVTMVSGCTTLQTHNVTIQNGPAILIQSDPIYCENEAQSFIIPDDLFDIAWDFGDVVSGLQNISTGDSVIHTFGLNGLYTITVSASDQYQCSSSATVITDIRANTLTGVINLAPGTAICYGDTALLTAPAGGIQWLWSNGETTDHIEVIETNQYGVLIEDAFHCTFTPPPQFVIVVAKPEVTIRAREILGPGEYGPWQDSLGLCSGVEFQIEAFSNGTILFHWN
ncbi:MAG: PKD domain-containing protein, partial [Bacteroidota bacterium]|nr:PKD domain-containing protein [Bacteroidota bacterium]